MNTITVIIAAAGQGERLAANTSTTPKQFTILGGVPIFVWSLTTFLQHPKIKEAVLVVPQAWLERTHTFVAQYLPKYIQQITVIAGGNMRQESVYLALENLASNNNPPQFILIHDAARPFVTSTSIDQIIATLESGSACTLAVPLSDSVRKIKGMTISEDLDRSSMSLMQTPQGAEFKLLLEAHRQARNKQYRTTDDAALIQAYGTFTKIVPGSRFNLKITEPDDLLIAKAFIETYDWSPGKVGNFVEKIPT